MLGVSRQTIRNYCRSSNELVWRRTIGGHRRVCVGSLKRWLGFDDEDDDGERKTVIYARVSTNAQKREGNLLRQKERLLEYCENELGCSREEVVIISECGSGLNEARKGYLRLIDIVISGNV